jgi:hypothetical protein
LIEFEAGVGAGRGASRVSAGVASAGFWAVRRVRLRDVVRPARTGVSLDGGATALDDDAASVTCGAAVPALLRGLLRDARLRGAASADASSVALFAPDAPGVPGAAVVFGAARVRLRGVVLFVDLRRRGAAFVSGADGPESSPGGAPSTALVGRMVLSSKYPGNTGSRGMRCIQYLLTPAGNWASPIGTFHLTVDKGDENALVRFCGTGVTKTSPTTFELTIADFYPTEELNVLIVDAILN